MKFRAFWPALLVALLLAPPAWAQETSLVPVTVEGETVRLAMRIYKPGASGRAPTLVFNHGSTGSGRDTSLFTRPIDFPALAQFFVQRGWAVVMPGRRGAAAQRGSTTRDLPGIARLAMPATSPCRSPARIAACATSRRRWTRSSPCPSSILAAS